MGFAWLLLMLRKIHGAKEETIVKRFSLLVCNVQRRSPIQMLHCQVGYSLEMGVQIRNGSSD